MVVVDDGVAIGATARTACQVVRVQSAAHVVLAVPVASPDVAARLGEDVDEVVCLSTPRLFSAVGEWYRDFSQTPDEEAVALLAWASGGSAMAEGDEVDAGGVPLSGDLVLSGGAEAVVGFAHGSGSSRHSPRNRSVATALNRAGPAPLLFDLLTPGLECENRLEIIPAPRICSRRREPWTGSRGPRAWRGSPSRGSPRRARRRSPSAGRACSKGRTTMSSG